MNTLFEGTLSYEFRISNILTKIREQSSSGLSLLTLSSPDQLTDGTVSIRDCRFITGAISTNDGVTGYAALKKLLSLALGTYSVSQLDVNQLADFDQDINLDLDRIIAVVPSLPENLSELFDQASLLDKVFSRTKPKEEKRMQPIVSVIDPPPLPPSRPRPESNNLLQSLVTSSSWQGINAIENAEELRQQGLSLESRENEKESLFSAFTALTTEQKFLSVLSIVVIIFGLFWLSGEIGQIFNAKTVAVKSFSSPLKPLAKAARR